MNERQIQDAIAEFLARAADPEGRNLRDQGRILDWKFACGRVRVDVLSRGLGIPAKRGIDALLYEGLLKIEGVDDVIINMVNPDAPTEIDRGDTAAQSARRGAGSTDRAASLPEKQAIPGVRFVIAVASGKGGVGKSTVAVNLAVALEQQGHKVGLLDADCYGPSIPVMLGIGDDEKPHVTEDRQIAPLRKWGLDVMSIGFFVERDNAVIWRGLMVTKALQQFFFDVAWRDLDFLVIDLPPGTGDTQLTMVQHIRVDGAIIVSTPQDVALADARKGLAMFRETAVPILGLVENMSYFECPHCRQRTEIFSHGGARRTAEELGAPFLGEIPLVTALRETSDGGTPFMATRDSSPARQAFARIADSVTEAAREHLRAHTSQERTIKR
jgi:ATP-binding protein involved in chromosome partitioning